MNVPFLLLFLLACDGAPGVQGPADGGVPGCSSNADCKGGLACVEATCQKCARDRECDVDQFCHPVQQLCTLKPCFGRDCGTHADCPLGRFCVQGLCLKPNETTSQGCQVVPCTKDQDCTSSQRCDKVDLVCEANIGCSANGCETGKVCNPGTGACEVGCTPQTEADLCGITRRCVENRCVECAADQDCGPGLTCDVPSGLCRGGQGCTSDRDCELGLVCNLATRQCTPPPPPCSSDEDCPRDYMCLLSTRRCEPASCADDRFEPNNDSSIASLVGPGELVALTLCQRELAADVDLFKVPLGPGDSFSASIETDVLAADRFRVSLHDPALRLLAQGDLYAVAQAGAEGGYFVRTTTSDPRARYALRLLISRGEPCDDDGFDDASPNNDYLTATPLDPGDWYNLAVCQGDPDWFVVRVPSDRQVRAWIDHDPTAGDLDLAVFDSDGKTLLAASATTEGIETVTARELGGGLAYLVVTGGPKTKNQYDLFVRIEGI